MNHTVNIKELLNTQSTGCRNGATNFTDSQFFFGSQFWREHSQSLSQDKSLSSRNSQQSSQECSDTKISTNYQSKPLLFGDTKNKQTLLDTFEEAKKKAKEKNDSDRFAKECLQIHETLTKNGDSSTEFAANMRSDVDCLRREQEEASSKQESMLEEALQMLNALVSEHPGKLCSVKVTDKAMQTSPGQDKGTQMAQNSCTPDSQVPDLDIAVKMRKKKPTSRYRRRPLVRHRSNHIVVEENSQPVMDCSKQRNVSRPLRQSPGLSKVSAHGPESLVQSNTKSRSSETAGCFITPLSCWSQESSGSESPRKVNCSSEIVLRDSSPPDALWQLFL
ncbi:interactor of HORMAD1 protein 1 isoform X3 [Phyllopteryx taeniolatus]|uniref:interactor of HORMAD1 protein 1 isoform X3 n=1 Tax=Phyllopteryx taeniolatus TaxID=161469 RepID=UPI002AD37FF2|nr:interactor of HORMAD1 protein 1 isoform X3 [Phyllopteryx taeniolatus]